MKHLKWVIVPALLFFAVSCAKFNSKKHYRLDSYFKSFFSFNNGSEWKYTLQSDTSVVETVKLVGFSKGIMSWDAFDQEFIQYDLHSDRDSIYKMRTVADDNGVALANLLVRDTFFRIAAQWFYNSNQFSGISGTGDTFNVHDTFYQNGKTYTDVIELRPKKSKYFKAVYMARNIGIIRKDFVSGRNYILKSYYVQ